MNRHTSLARIERSHGIYLPEAVGYIGEKLTPEDRKELAKDFALACDAQPQLVTVSNAGIPAYLSMYIDPVIIDVLFSPMKIASILGGEQKKGDWTTLTATFPIGESVGEVSAYGDWNNNGESGYNVNFPQFQSFHYQTVTEWGERQLAMAGEAKIDWATGLNKSSILNLNKFQNKMYAFGIAGLQNYGLLNNPLLSAPLAPGVKATNSPFWMNGTTVTATPTEIFNDISAVVGELILQSAGINDQETRMILALSPLRSLALNRTNETFATNVEDMLKKNFPKLEVVTAVEYGLVTGGQFMQVIAPEVMGQDTGFPSFTEKLRAHTIVREMSAFKQKKSQGGWGVVMRQPFAIASMIGF